VRQHKSAASRIVLAVSQREDTKMSADTSNTVRRIHNSKRDRWMVTLFWVVSLSLLGAGLFLAISPGPIALRIALPILFLLSSDFMLWTLYGTRYLLTDSGMKIRSGPFRWWVSYSDIEHVAPTRSALAGPACSMDRLQVVCKGASLGLMISPEHKSEFLKDVAALSPSLLLQGDQLIRAASRT
jgi:hypothetical protein